MVGQPEIQWVYPEYLIAIETEEVDASGKRVVRYWRNTESEGWGAECKGTATRFSTRVLAELQLPRARQQWLRHSTR